MDGWLKKMERKKKATCGKIIFMYINDHYTTFYECIEQVIFKVSGIKYYMVFKQISSHSKSNSSVNKF